LKDKFEGASFFVDSIRLEIGSESLDLLPTVLGQDEYFLEILFGNKTTIQGSIKLGLNLGS